MDTEPVVWVDPRDLEAYLEHDGSINDEEYGYDGAYLDILSESQACLTERSPVLLSVDAENKKASVSDGNHRLILALEDAKEGHEVQVPVRVTAEPSLHPGFDYAGEFGWPIKPPMRRCVRRKSAPLTQAAIDEALRQAAEAPPPSAEQLRAVRRIVRGY